MTPYELNMKMWEAMFGQMFETVSRIQDSPRCEYEMGESSYGAGDSLPCGRPADDSGLCAKHRGEMGL